MNKIRITKTPQAKSMPAHSGNQTPPQDNTAHPFPGRFMGGNSPEIKINQTLQPTDREHATLEAELGETVITNLQGEGIPEFYKIGGKRHSQGGTPLNLPANSFIFSRDNKLKIKDSDMLSLFGKTSKGLAKKGITPAKLSMEYNLNKFREILVNPFSDKLQKETAEKMIQNYNIKLGQLALVQESMKGFEGDIPAIAQGYIQHVGINPEEFFNVPSMGQDSPEQQTARFGLEVFKNGGNTPAKKKKVLVKRMPQFEGGAEFTGGQNLSGNWWDTSDLTGNQNASITPGQQPELYTIDPNQAGSRFGITSVPDGTADISMADYMKTDLKNKRNIGQITKSLLGPGMDFAAMIGRNRTEPKTNIEDLTTAENVFTSNEVPNYGMNMFNTQGVVDPYRVKEAPQFTGFNAQYGGEQNYFQPGGSTGVQTSSKATPKQNIPKEGVFWDPEADGYDESKVKENHYIKKNGRWYKITGYGKPKYEGKADEKLGVFGSDYELLKKKFENPETRKLFYEQYKKEMQNAKPNKYLTQADIDAALKMDEKQVIDVFLKKQAINLAINTKYGDLSSYDKKNLWDKNPDLANKTAKELGYEPLSKAQTAAFQAGYIGINNLTKDDKTKDLFKDFMIEQVGLANDKVTGTAAGSISKIDGWDGNTTSGQVFLPKASEMKLQELEDITEEKDMDVEHLAQNPAQTEPAQFWTQDLNNIGFGLGELYGIDKAKPWQGQLQYKEAIPAVQDFRGSAARIGSAASAGARQAAELMGPQQFAATYAGIQSGAVDPILKTQEAERMGNQDVINKFEMFNNQQFAQHAAQKASLDTALYDKHIMANQQFKNAKTQARDKLRGLLNQAWTNRAGAYNAQTDDFGIDPTTGYMYKKNTNRPILPGTGASDQLYANYKKIMTENPGMDSESARKLAKDMAGIPEYPTGVNPAAYMYPNNV
jgi:hypothetical protein